MEGLEAYTPGISTAGHQWSRICQETRPLITVPYSCAEMTRSQPVHTQVGDRWRACARSSES